MGKYAALGITIALGLLSGCAQRSEPPVANIPNSAPTSSTCAPVQEGRASWYGNAHKGEKTASGEPYDPNALTAAHRTLPLGTPIQVTNLENGRTTTLVVNDRGPHRKGRVLDVSKKGAQDLGFVEDGTTPVRIVRADCAKTIEASAGK